MIHTQHFPERGLVVHQCQGRITLEEVSEAARAHIASADCTLVLWDLGSSDVSAIESGQIRSIAQGASDSAKVRQGGKTALVAHTDGQYGLCRMYEIYLSLQLASIETGIFRSRREAELWLDGSMPPGIGLGDSAD
jgi:hypothetical protein